MASNYIDPRIAKMQAREATREIDYRYVRFNLETAEGQQGYRDYLLAEIEQWASPSNKRVANPSRENYQWGNELEVQQNVQIFDVSHFWYAEAINRKVLGLGEPGPWKRGDRIGRPDHVDLFI